MRAPWPPPPAPRSPALRAEPVSATLVSELLDRADVDVGRVALALTAWRLAAAQTYDELLSLPSLRGVDSHQYQLDTVRRVLRTLRGRALLADEVGLGKTIEAIITMRELEVRGLIHRSLVLVPPAIVRQWAAELEAKAGICVRTTEDDRVRRDPETFWGESGVVVASLALARTARHAPLVRAKPWDLVVVDEAHHLKNRSTLGWKLVDGLESRFLLMLTATPIETDLEELYNLVTLLRPGQFATISEFRKAFVDRKNPSSPKNRERLRQLLSEVMIRNTRAQCGLQLPPRFVSTIRVEPEDEERALYDAVLAYVRSAGEARAGAIGHRGLLLLEAGSSPRAVQATLDRMREARPDPELDRLSSLARAATRTRKVDALLEIVRAHGGEHVLVFSRYRETLAFVRDALAAAGLAVEVFQGGMSAAARDEAVARFRAGGGVLAATDVGAEGLNLQFCSVLVDFDLPWNPMLLEQRIGRLHRMGQTREVRVYNLCAGGTAEERVLEVLHDRVHLFELVVGEMDMVLGNLADDRDLEERILALYAGSRDESDVARGFDALAVELQAARTKYEGVRALDEALFGEDYT